jgi:hypothetical protein
MNIRSQAIDQDRTRVRLEQVFANAAHCIAKLLTAVERRTPEGCAFDDAQLALSSLPISTQRFAIASHRLDNARLYCARGERGAAAYELQMLHRTLLHEARNGR